MSRTVPPTLWARAADALRWACSVGLAWPLLAGAGGLSVLPTRIDFNAQRGVASVLLTNTGATTVTVESQVLVWPEGAGGQAENDVVVTPAVVTLPPGQRTRVRVGLLRQGSGAAERAYRLYFTELPAPSPPQRASIGVRLRIGLPVFVAPQLVQAQPLTWSLARGENGPVLEVRNRGNVHARVAEAVLLGAPMAEGLRLDLRSPYVLAGATVKVPVPSLPADGSPLESGALRVRWTDRDHELQAAVAAAP